MPVCAMVRHDGRHRSGHNGGHHGEPSRMQAALLCDGASPFGRVRSQTVPRTFCRRANRLSLIKAYPAETTEAFRDGHDAALFAAALEPVARDAAHSSAGCLCRCSVTVRQASNRSSESIACRTRSLSPGSAATERACGPAALPNCNRMTRSTTSSAGRPGAMTKATSKLASCWKHVFGVTDMAGAPSWYPRRALKTSTR